MSRTLIYNARLIDPDTQLDDVGYVVINDDRIEDVVCHGSEKPVGAFDHIINAEKHVLCPALIDLFTGVGEPAGAHKETFATLSYAALASGIGAVMIDPDTSPVIDTPAVADYALGRGRDNAKIRIYVSAALTNNLDNMEMSQIGLLKDSHISCITSCDYAVPDSLLLYRSFAYAAAEDIIVATYPDDARLSGHGIAHDSFLSSLYGLESVPSVSEQIGLSRDIALAKETGVKLHVRGVSSAASLPLIEMAKNDGVDITISVSAQHIALNENDITPYKTFLKMRPPLRSEEDRIALTAAVHSGLIDHVISQHRPRHSDSKRLPYAEADYGGSTIDTLLPIILELYHKEECSLAEALRPVTSAPAKRFKMSGGFLQKGHKADLILIDINQGYKLTRDKMYSNATNTPYENRLLQGICKMTMINGVIEYES